MNRATVLIRDDPIHRKQSFVDGLKRHGYEIKDDPVRRPRPGDVLVIWTRHRGRYGDTANTYERHGAKVVVVENGYLNKHPFARRDYAIALDDHNGAGRWYYGGPERWAKIEADGVEIKPWRQGENIVVREQRGIGSSLMASPPNWHSDTIKALTGMTGLPVILQAHPGRISDGVDDTGSLANAHTLVNWGSSLAVRATVLGVPVVYCAPHSIIATATLGRGLEKVANKNANNKLPDRLPALRRMAWAMWTPEEIEAGEPFDQLLRMKPK